MPNLENLDGHFIAQTPSDDINSRRRNIYFYPPTPAALAIKIMEQTGLDLVQETNDDGMSMFVARPHEVRLSDKEIFAEVSGLYTEEGFELQKFPGLPENPTWTEWRSYVKNGDE